MSTPSPSSDVSVTAAGCPACGQQLPAGRSRRFCSPACRQAAYRRRHQPDTREVPLARNRSRREGTVYQCPDCETRYFANSGALIAHGPADASAQAASAPAVRR